MYSNRPEPPDSWWEFNFSDQDLYDFVGEIHDEEEEFKPIKHSKNNQYCVCDECMEQQLARFNYDESDNIPF